MRILLSFLIVHYIAVQKIASYMLDNFKNKCKLTVGFRKSNTILQKIYALNLKLYITLSMLFSWYNSLGSNDEDRLPCQIPFL